MDNHWSTEKTDVSYKVDVKYTTFKKTNARLYGDFVAGLMKSNIDLKLFIYNYVFFIFFFSPNLFRNN